ncbi:MAG: putative sulfate exporter family transporter [Pontixanthobacter sp.]
MIVAGERLQITRRLIPGTALALVIAAAATFLSEHYSAPVMLYALLLGMAFSYLADDPRSAPGIEFASKVLLRVGIALLGLRISWEQISTLGWQPVVMIALLIVITIAVAIAMAKAMGLNPLFGFLSGGATAICGASAALALSATLPAHARKEQATLFTVVGVSTLSTIAMISYPLIADLVGFSDHQAGVFIGATIHDVAQVVGAGYAISQDAGDTATIVKLLRVAMLLPVVLAAGLITRSQAEAGASRPPLIPWFAAAFLILVALNSVASIPAAIAGFGGGLSRWCLVIAISAIGMKTRMSDILTVGIRPIALMLLETILLALMVIAALKFGGS